MALTLGQSVRMTGAGLLQAFCSCRGLRHMLCALNVTGSKLQCCKLNHFFSDLNLYNETMPNQKFEDRSCFYPVMPTTLPVVIKSFSSKTVNTPITSLHPYFSYLNRDVYYKNRLCEYVSYRQQFHYT